MDLVILSARIFTADPDWTWTTALAIKDGRIADLGSDDYIKTLITTETEVLELPGLFITPGLTDAHLHFMSFGKSLKEVDLRGLKSWQEGRARLAEAVKSHRPGQWIIGRGWNHHQWADGVEPTAAMMDDISPDNPVAMTRVCGHVISVNSKGLEAAGITVATPDPDGGKLDRDETGRPTGVLRNARKMLEAVIPPPTLEEWKAAALAAQDAALKSGLTGVHTIESLDQYAVLAELEAEGKLKLRVHHLLQADDIEAAEARGIKPGTGSDHLWFGMIKLFADGSLGGGTALLHQPYEDDPGNTGLAYTPPEVLEEKIRKAYEHGLDVAIHSIGDKAVTNSLDAFAAARRDFPGEHRDRVEHVQLTRPQDIDRFYQMDVTASVQPIFIPTDWPTAEKRWGPERCAFAYAWQTLAQAGVRLQFGSDCPVEPIAPLLGLQAAVARKGCDGVPEGGWRPEEKVGLEDALTAFTLNPAYTARKDQVFGSLAPGKLADLTVLGVDLEEVPPEKWHEVPVEMTIIDGQVVYKA